jgi:hypothetical protein
MERKDAIAMKPVSIRQPTGTRAQVLGVIKESKDGMTTDEVRITLPKIHPQTVNSAVNDLAKQGWLKDTGKRRDTRAAGGRKAIVYRAEANPKPQLQTAKATPADDLIVQAIEDETIVKSLERWKVGKTRKEAVAKAVHLAYPLVGRTPHGFHQMFNRLIEEAEADGTIIGSITLGPSKK